MTRSPQKENGYTPIAHQILGEIGRHGLNGTQRGIIDQLWRYTYGFKRKEATLSLSFLASALDKTKKHIDKELSMLIARNVVIVVSDEPNRTRVLRFNKDFDSWKSALLIEGKNQKGDEDMPKDVPYKEIIDHLNAKAGKRYSHKTKPTQALINGRFAEGRTLADFLHVIDVKCAQWLGDPKWEAYLRPSTLFRPTNFENYLNQTAESGKPIVQQSAADRTKDLLRRKMEEAQRREGNGNVEDHSADFHGLPEP